MTRLELGSGQRPSPGYLTSDINAFDGIDFICSPEQIGLASGSLDEVLALGVMEHLTYAKFDLTLTNVFRMLRPGGFFLFDCPELLAWCEYYSMLERGEEVPFTREHILSTLFGWQRFDGDTHASGWSEATITKSLNRACFQKIEFGVDQMLSRGHMRRRFERPDDAHIYVCATK